MQKTVTKLYYFHDPMCSWCWGFKATYQQLCKHLPGNVQLVRILGGLAPDTDQPMPEDLKDMIRTGWTRIEETIPGVKFNFAFWDKCQPRRSTYAACRAVIAARQQGKQYDELMTSAIQDAYYLQARNPADDQTLIELATELGLNKQQFLSDFYSKQTDTALQKDIHFAREMFVESFPFLLLVTGDIHSVINIDYNNYQVMLNQVKEKIDALC